MTTRLSAAERAVLGAICDTLAPALDHPEDPEGLFATGADAAGTVERAERLIDAVPDPVDRSRLLLLLSALDSRFVNLLLSGRFASFARMPRAMREAVLQGWATSRLTVRRAGFQALKRLAYVSHYCWPTADGGHPAWRAVGYPGPLPWPETMPEPLPVERPTDALQLECDVVVVGSGAGGGVVAGRLAAAGHSVIVLEKGPNADPRTFTQVEGDMLSRFYLDSGLKMTRSGSMPILAGSAVGGGTLINYTTSFRLPEDVREEWAARSGVSFFTGHSFNASFDRIAARVNVGTRWCTPAPRDALLERGLERLGWHADVIPRNVRDCREGLECGYCGYGCRHGAKQGTMRTFLVDAVAAGARIIPECEAHRVLIERGRAKGVEGLVRGADGRLHAVTVRARAVVAACGAINTPALLRRSGLQHPRIGAGLHLHPGTGVLGVFDEPVEPWSGALQTRYSEEFARQHGPYGWRFETVPVHFAMAASGFGWESARSHREDISRLRHSSLVGILLRDREPGRVVVGKDGRARVNYELSLFDAAHARHAVHTAAQVLAEAGAKAVVTVQTPPARGRPGAENWLDLFREAADHSGYTRCRMSYISFHQMGTAAIGANPRLAPVNDTGETYEVRGLYVADSSLFPGSSGVNPMLTIMALADHVAGAIDAAL